MWINKGIERRGHRSKHASEKNYTNDRQDATDARDDEENLDGTLAKDVALQVI